MSHEDTLRIYKDRGSNVCELSRLLIEIRKAVAPFSHWILTEGFDFSMVEISGSFDPSNIFMVIEPRIGKHAAVVLDLIPKGAGDSKDLITIHAAEFLSGLESNTILPMELEEGEAPSPQQKETLLQ